MRTEPVRPSGNAGDGWGRAAAYDAYADGLHTYAIWLLRDHDAAVDALYCAFVMADRYATQLRQPEHVHPWLYAITRHECHLRTGNAVSSSSSSSSLPPPSPVSGRLRPPTGLADPSGSLAELERNLRRAEFHLLEWPESEGLAPAHKEILELTIRHGLDSQGLGLVLGLGRPSRYAVRTGQSGQSGHAGRDGRCGAAQSSVTAAGLVGSAGSRGFGMLADAWRELERSLAAVAVAKGSHEHCAQLAELTFGWSGRLTANLRTPLTEHVDSCTRCQHYLHTVIGTPAAPTILPFVAAPRLLREIVLGELHDPNAAQDAGVDHDAIARRIEHFTLDGFPTLGEPTAPRRLSSRRVQDRSRPGEPRSEESPTRRTPDTNLPRAAIVPSISEPSPANEGVFRAPGSWAARVLPPLDDQEPLRPWLPIGPVAASRADQLTATQIIGPTIAPGAPPSRGGGSGLAHSNGNGTGVPQRPTFVVMPSDRLDASARPSDQVAADPPTVPLPKIPNIPKPRAAVLAAHPAAFKPPQLTAPTLEPPRGPDGKPKARHKPRRARQAVTSAVALGAVGAVAAVAAALLGLTSEDHSQGVLDDPGLALPTDPTAESGDLTVTVSTAPAAPVSAPGHAGSAPTNDKTAHLAGAVAAPGAPTGVDSFSGQPAVDPADFHVSVNQRSGDPKTIVVLLRNTGPTPISWNAEAQDSWIALSQTSGSLGAGQSLVVTARATSATPAGQWTSEVRFSPGGTVLKISGDTANTPPPATAAPTPPPSHSTSPTPTPTAPSSARSGGSSSPSVVRQSGSVSGGAPSSTG